MFYNLFFLLSALSQLIPMLQVGSPISFYAPLSFVLLLTMMKEFFDDYKRYKLDKKMNSAEYKVITNTGNKKTI